MQSFSTTCREHTNLLYRSWHSTGCCKLTCPRSFFSLLSRIDWVCSIQLLSLAQGFTFHKMARPRSRRIASEDSDSGNAKDVGKKTKEKGSSSTRKKKTSTFVVSIPKTRVKVPSVEARAPRKLIIQNTSSSNSSPLPSSTVSYVNRPSFPSGPLSFKNKNYQVSGASQQTDE